MSEALALSPSPVSNEAQAKLGIGARIGSALQAVMESLVSAQRKRFEDSDPLLYRYPPF